MIKKITKLCLAGTLALGTAGTAFAAEEEVVTGPLAAENFSATLTMTTNYIYRGLSFSNDHPALQGSFDWSYDKLFAGVWGSSLSDQDGSSYELENDFYFGYADSYAGVDWFVMPIYYHFYDYDENNNRGSNGSSTRADVFELWLDASYAINDTVSVHGMYAYSPDFFFESGDSNYVKGDVTVQLSHGFSLNAGLGYQDVKGGDTGSFTGNQGWDYTHWDIGLSKDLAGFNLDLRYSDTSADSSTDDLNVNFLGVSASGATSGNSDDTVTFTVSRTF